MLFVVVSTKQKTNKQTKHKKCVTFLFVVCNVNYSSIASSVQDTKRSHVHSTPTDTTTVTTKAKPPFYAAYIIL